MKKICVEVFSNYLKIKNFGTVGNYIKQRSEHFAKYGWECVFIDENDLNNEQKIMALLSK